MPFSNTDTDYGCSTVLHLCLLRVRNIGKHKHTTEFPHVFADASDTELRMYVQKMAKMSDFTRLSVR